MPQAGWYPDPSAPRDPRAPVAYERWYDGARWTATVRPAPAGASKPPGRRRSTLVFLVVVVVVTALVAAVVIGLSRIGAPRTTGAVPTSTVSGWDDSSPSPTPEETATPTPASSTPTPSARPVACDTVAPDEQTPSTSAPDRVGAGGLSFAKLAGQWSAPYGESRVPYGRDTRAQSYVLPEKKPWAASANVGVTAFPAFPGLAPAASAMLQCVLTSDFYVSVQVKLARSSSRSITVSGHRAVQLDATLTFSDPELTTRGSALRFVVVDTQPATFLFLATPVERQDLLDQADRTTASLRVS